MFNTNTVAYTPARLFGRKRRTHSKFKIQYEVIMIANLTEKITNEKDVINLSYRSVFRETCTFIEKYLYGFELIVVINIKSRRNSALQQALHVSSPVISLGFLRVVVFLFHHIPYTIFQRLSNTQLLILKAECFPTLIYLPYFKISVSFSACETSLTYIFHLMNEFKYAGAFMKYIARYHVMQPLCSKTVNSKCLRKKFFWKHIYVRKLIKLQILFCHFLVVAFREVTVG